MSERTGWDRGLSVTADGKGLVGHAGAVLLRRLADRVGLTDALAGVLPSGTTSSWKAMGLANLPSKSWETNASWMFTANLAADLDAWLWLLTLHDQADLADAEPDTMRFRLYQEQVSDPAGREVGEPSADRREPGVRIGFDESGPGR